MRPLSFLLIGAGCLLGSLPAHAQEFWLADDVPAISADTTTRIRFSIPAQPLSGALREFSRQASIEVQIDLAAAAGARSRAIAGTLTAPAALRQLLAGTGFSPAFGEDGSVLVLQGGSGAYSLAPLTVVAPSGRGYAPHGTSTATRTDTPLRDVPQSVSVVTREMIADQSMRGMSDVVRFVPGITMGAGEGHRDAPTIRGNSSTADFFVDGMRDDAQYFRDVYNVERVEALKGPNAMIFGRGGGGGVVNRVVKEAEWGATRSFTLEGGSYSQRRATVDVGQGLGSRVAGRLSGMYENSGGFRDAAELQRFGLNPTLAVALGARTMVRGGYEYFSDERTVDRGIPSFQGRPSDAGVTTFFGNPDASFSTLRLNAATALVEHAPAGGLVIRNRTRFADYDKFYQNSYPGAVNAEGTQVTLSAYDSETGRRNLLNQTDIVLNGRAAGIGHTLLLGAEVGRQETENFRRTGYYNDAAPTLSVPFAEPTVATPITFRQSATDADNRTTANVTGVYVQDQLALSERVQVLLGVRFDRFGIAFRNNRNDERLDRSDALLSPRAGLVLKPAGQVSVYGSYAVSHLPSAGDQFGSLTATSETLEPERFTNYEAGAKWDLRPSLALTAALYRLDRTNTSAPDPSDPGRTVQTGSQRSTGWEVGLSGDIAPWWQVVGGFSAQRARITSRTGAAEEGAKVPLVPERTFSLWSRWRVLEPLAFGVGVVHRSDMFAAIDNAVTLPGFTRADGAVFLRLSPALRAQVNVENLLDERYFDTSHGNNNIIPGAPRTVRISLSTAY